MVETLCGLYDVSFQGRRVGTLTVSIDGLNTVFDCRCSAGSSGEVQRLNCVSCGVPIAIGVLAPDGNGGLHLKKCLTKNALQRLGLTAIESCYLSTSAAQTAQIEPAEHDDSAWRSADEKDLQFENPWLTLSCRGRTDILACGSSAQLQLAVPIEPDAPFPLMPVFCFGQSVRIGDRNYVVFSLENGKFIQQLHNPAQNCT